MKCSIIFLFLAIASPLIAQDKTLPFAELPAYPETFTAGTVASRMVDGVGFRFYWATEALRPADLSYSPSEGARSSFETIAHIYGLTQMLLTSVKLKDNSSGNTKLTFDEMRRAVLLNLKAASDKLRKSSDQDLKTFNITFNNHEYPFWNQVNGPIADCLWHIGQVVTFRRSSGNPFSSKVEVFTGEIFK